MARGHGVTDDFEEFFQREYPLVYSGLVLAVRDRDLAREAANEAFARAWVRRARVLRMEHPRAWVAKVGFNYALKRLKAREVPVEAPAAPQEAAIDPGREVELRDQLRALLAVLSPQERAVLVLRHYLDLSTRDTARQLRISEGTVKRYCSDALRRLQDTLPTGQAESDGPP